LEWRKLSIRSKLVRVRTFSNAVQELVIVCLNL
jgi:hypothetical protein